MDEEKRNKIVAAVVVNAILFVFIIVAVLIAQVVQISVLRRRKAALINEYNTLVLELESTEDFVDKYEKESQLEDLIKAMYNMGMTEEEIKSKLITPAESATVDVLVSMV